MSTNGPVPSLWRVAGRTTIRLSQYNRFHATIRHPKYLQDYKCTITPEGSVKDRRSYERILKKWKLPFLPNPQEARQSSSAGGAWSKEVFQLTDILPERPVQAIPHEKEKTLRKIGKKWVAIPDKEIVMSRVSRKTMKKRLSQLNKKLPLEEIMPVHRIDFTPHLKKGRYLTLRVNLTETKKKLIREAEHVLNVYEGCVNKKVKRGKVFCPMLKGNVLVLNIDLASQKDSLRRFNKLIHECRPLVKRPSTRERETIIDPWEVYDAHTYEGKTLLRIAKEKYDFKSNPAYDEIAMIYYKRVEAAYKKAERMILAVASPHKQ